MTYKLILRPEAEQDFAKFDHSVQVQIIKKLEQLEQNPYLGKALGNRAQMDLHGFYKLYAVKKRVRIVYEIQDKELIIRVIAIGKRDKSSVYQKAKMRHSEG